MHRKLNTFIVVLAILTLCGIPCATAGVSNAEVKQLGNELTPFGAEKKGNAEGTIPEWTGGIKEQLPGYKGPGTRHVDPFKDEKPLFSITAKNLDTYAKKLSPGQIAFFKKYPDTYRIDVYPTHRTQAAPQWVYENTKKNASRAETTDGGNGIANAYGGIPFPIPKNGAEIMWNHLLRWTGQSDKYPFENYVVYGNGEVVVTGRAKETINKYPYYQKDMSLEDYNGEYFLSFVASIYPERLKGELSILRDSLNSPRAAWKYMVGQRRVRRAPTIGYDSPGSGLSGLMCIDEYYGFNGRLDRFDWKFIEKREMYIPYNCYKMDEKADLEKIYHAHHINPDYLRWELHRVWVVEATLKEGQRHLYGRRVYVIDEDAWNVVMSDNYDNQGELWRIRITPSYNAYELPGVRTRQTVGYDLQSDIYAVQLASNLEDTLPVINIPVEDDFFTAAELRKQGKR